MADHDHGRFHDAFPFWPLALYLDMAPYLHDFGVGRIILFMKMTCMWFSPCGASAPYLQFLGMSHGFHAWIQLFFMSFRGPCHDHVHMCMGDFTFHHRCGLSHQLISGRPWVDIASGRRLDFHDSRFLFAHVCATNVENCF